MGCCADAPDTRHLEVQAQNQGELGARALDLSERQYEDSSALQREFADVMRANAEGDAEIKDIQMQLMLDQQQRREEIFDPLEARLVDEAENYDSDARVLDSMGKADAAVMQAFDRQRVAGQRDMARLGFAPNSGRALALRQASDVDAAAAAANASTQAGERTRSLGFARRMDVSQMGRNNVSNQTGAAASALQAGQSVNNGYSTVGQAGNQNFNAAMNGFGTASSAFGSAGNMYGKVADMKAQDGGGLAQLGQVAGMGIKAYTGGRC